MHRNKRLSFTNIAFLNVYGSGKSVLHPWEIALFGVGVASAVTSNLCRVMYSTFNYCRELKYICAGLAFPTVWAV
jgi:hypothetical protein